MELVTTKICKTSDIGVNENLFGGTMLAWLDEAGAIFASKQINDQNVVTLKISEVLFKNPVKVKDCINIYARVEKRGKTSLVVELAATRHNFVAWEDNKPEEKVCMTTMVFVRIGKDGKPKNIDS